VTYQTFPTDIFFSKVRRIPHFDTSFVGRGKNEQRISWSADPQYEIAATLENFSEEDADRVMAFFEARRGAFEGFYFQNPEESFRGTTWQSLKAYSLKQIVRPIAINNRSYKVTIAGTSGVSQPTFPTTVNGTVADGTVTWRENTYLVRFKEDIINADYFSYQLYNLGEISFMEL
jgi:hypothetical protein